MIFVLLQTSSPFAFASRYADLSADIAAKTSIAAPPEAIFTHLLDLNNLQQHMPCVGKWEMSQRTFGEGASAMVRYDVGAMHRKLPLTLSRADAPYRIDLEHLGNLGFTTVVQLRAIDEAHTEVSLLTPLNAPPWPLRKYYHQTIQPGWAQCYATTLDNLAAAFVAADSPALSPAFTPALTPDGPNVTETFEPISE